MKTKLLILLFWALFGATQVMASSTVTVQIGFTKKSGETVPVVNTAIRLLKNKIVFGALAPNSDWQKIIADIDKSVEENTVYISTTDFLGKASFTNVEDGIYYVFCDARIRGARPTYQKVVVVKGEPTFVSLDNSDIAG